MMKFKYAVLASVLALSGCDKLGQQAMNAIPDPSPQQAQAVLWNACPDPQYVVDVAIGSNHSRGTAIDVTLMDDRGNLLDMGAGFDEMHDRSHAWHPSVPPAAQRNRLLLNAIMFGGGFVGITSEWWHFELPDAARYPLLDDQIDCYTVTPITTQHSL